MIEQKVQTCHLAGIIRVVLQKQINPRLRHYVKAKRNKKTPSKRTRNLTLAVILVVSSFIAYLFMILPGYLDNRGVQINIGEAATEDILAPYSINFESKVLTERARQNAANAVEDVYLTSDPSIARHQLNVLDAALSYITTVKNDPLSTHEQKLKTC